MQGSHSEAVKYSTIASAKDPDNYIYKFYAAAALSRDGQREKAIMVLEELVETGKDMPEVYNHLGYMYAEEGRNLDRAIKLIKKAIEISPENGAYIDSLGWAYYKKGMVDEALKELKKAAGYMPNDPTIREHLGDVYFSKGEIKEALRQWKIALKADPENKELAGKIKRSNRKARK